MRVQVPPRPPFRLRAFFYFWGVEEMVSGSEGAYMSSCGGVKAVFEAVTRSPSLGHKDLFLIDHEKRRIKIQSWLTHKFYRRFACR